MATYKHIRSNVDSKRPTTSLADGQIAINTNVASPGVFFKDSAGTGIVKVGPVHVGTSAPNSTPGAGGSTGNSKGEQWLDTSLTPAQLKVWNGSAWVGVVADELPVSKLQNGSAYQLLQTDAAGTGVEWASDIDVPGSLNVTSTAVFDSTVSHPLGSAAAPTITFTGDANTGIYSPGIDQVAITTGGTGRLYIDSSGNVAIGTSSPNLASGGGISLYSSSNARIKFANSTTGTATSDGTQLYALGDNFHIENKEAGFIATYTSGFERMRIDSSGRVGIGIAPSSSPLEVLSGTSNSSLIEASGASAGRGLKISTYANTANDAGVLIEAPHSNYGQLAFGTAGTERLRIDSSGNVGIGTSSPSTKLHIASTAAGGDVHITNASGQNCLLEIAGNGNTIGSGSALYGQDASNNVYAGWARGAHPVLFGTNGQERMRIDSSGDVTIQSSTPLLTLKDTDNAADSSVVSEVQGRDSASSIFWRLGHLSTGNQSLYLYNQRSDALLLGTAGTERMRIDSSGKVGIGTSSPGRNLTVQNASTIVAASLVSNPANIAYLLFGDTDSDAQGRVQYDNSSDSLELYSSGSERLRIDSAGNVGIGTTSPQHALVVGSGTDDALNVDTQSAGGGVVLRSYDDGTTDYEPFGIAAEYVNFYIRTGVNSSAEKARIDSSGRLLVGTSTSSATLTAVFQGNSAGSANSGVLGLCIGSATPTDGSNLGRLIFGDNTHVAGAQVSAQRDGGTWSAGSKPGRLVFSTTADGASSPTERMRISSSGWVSLKAGSNSVTDSGNIYFNPDGNATNVPFIGTGGASSSNNDACYAVYSTSLNQYQFYVGYAGTVYARSASISSLSDQREKQNIQDLDVGLSEILALQPRRFDWKDGSGQNIAGFVAQEVELVLPDLVEDYQFNESETRKSLKMGDMIPALVKAIQEQQAVIVELQAEVAALKAQ